MFGGVFNDAVRRSTTIYYIWYAPLWPGLTRFLEDARIPLDNNATERGLRGMVVGRKNHYGSRDG